MTNKFKDHATPSSICSVITEKYVPFARTLCDSFLEHEPDGTCFILIVDGLSGKLEPAIENFRVLTPKDLKVPQFDRFVQKYTAFELCCAMKPYLLNHLIAVYKLDRVLYFDSDILILSPLQHLLAELDDSSVLVTPHLDADFPLDGKLPDNATIMNAGVINGGFVGVRRTASGLKFLEWWSHKLKDYCINNQSEGYFVDQKHLEHAGVLFPELKVLDSTQYNVAYWNLHSRLVSKNSGTWFSNDEPICFYHFSGFDPETETQLSRHQNRINLNSNPVIKELCALYAAKLLDNGYFESKSWSYRKANELNGESMGPDLRLLLQKLDISRPLNLNDDASFRSQQRPRISVVLALDKKTTDFTGALGSILLQDYGTVEVIMITIGVTCETKKQLRLFDDWAECIHLDENTKLSDAFNIGIEAAKGPIVAWMTPMDCLYQGALSKVAEYFKNDSSLDVIIGQSAYETVVSHSTENGYSSLQDIEELLEAGFISGARIFSSKRFLEHHVGLQDYQPLAMNHEYILSLAQYSRVRILADAFSMPFAPTNLGAHHHLDEVRQIVEIYFEKLGHVPTKWLRRLPHQRAARASRALEVGAKIVRKAVYFLRLVVYSLKYKAK